MSAKITCSGYCGGTRSCYCSEDEEEAMAANGYHKCPFCGDDEFHTEEGCSACKKWPDGSLWNAPDPTTPPTALADDLTTASQKTVLRALQVSLPVLQAELEEERLGANREYVVAAILAEIDRAKEVLSMLETRLER